MDEQTKQYLDSKFFELAVFLKGAIDENQALISALEFDESPKEEDGTTPKAWVAGISPAGVAMTSEQADDAVAKHSIVLSVARVTMETPSGKRIAAFQFRKRGMFGAHIITRRRRDQ